MKPLADRYDALVVGCGIAGMQAALDLAEQGYQILMVEKEPSVGGKMIGLNKVFPTLDCSSCICTPRMAEASHHPHITMATYTEVDEVARHDGGFRVRITRKPRYVREDDCIGCSRCEQACPVDVPHEFEYGLGARRAIYIPHSNAIPQVAVLDPVHCTFCGKCAKVCPTECVDYLQEPEHRELEVGTVIVATGLETTPLGAKAEYGGGRFANVMNPLAMERVQSSSGPYGRVMRPSDGKVPRSVAYVHCAGSRDRTLGVPYCSRVCCMYSIKQAVLLKHLVHGVDVTLYHMDIRAFGKGYEQFYRRAVEEGVRVVKGKVGRIGEAPDGDLLVRVEMLDEDGRVEERRHDLVVLALGLRPAWQGEGTLGIEVAEDGFFRRMSPKLFPARSTVEGIFVAGVAMGPKDIPDAIIEAGSAAMEASIFLSRHRAARHLTAVGTN